MSFSKIHQSKSLISTKINKTAFFVQVMRILAVVFSSLMVLSLFFTIVGKYTINEADDPVETYHRQLLTIEKQGVGLDAHKKQGEADFADGSTIEDLMPMPNVLSDEHTRQKRAVGLVEHTSDPGFPPQGERISDLTAKVFFENQRRFEDVKLEVVHWNDAIYVAGAGMCEVVQSRYVLLKPCIFRDRLVPLLGDERSSYEVQILQSLSFFVSLPFEPYARHITSFYQCDDVVNDFKMSVQFMKRQREGFISLRLPFSVSEVRALEDLQKNEQEPCTGIDVFFEPEQLVKLLAVIDGRRTKGQPADSLGKSD